MVDDVDPGVRKVWEEFWEPLFTEAALDGVAFEVQVMNELYDYRQWMSNFHEVVSYISDGQLSKINYAPHVYMEAFDRAIQNAYETGYSDRLEEESLNPPQTVSEAPDGS